MERRARDKAALRERILDAARAIALNDGFAGLTMRKLAAAIEYAPGTIYLHFDGRDAIARELCLEGYRALLAALEPAAGIADPRQRLAALARAFVGFGLQQREMYRLILMEDPKLLDALYRDRPIDDPDGPGTRAFLLLVQVFADLGAAAPDRRAEVLLATLHGIVSLKLTCERFLRTPAEDLVTAALERELATA
ncbi:AcrR family transcriptional regulator [Inquilinus ginsengisoli]|uniref:AcrR family transcriptional regulator n=1 Tax=Inquilinus ginsengisoli TaxID=363840 RepID=A0ABU1JY44_9PROT|nr:TetR/AcrR family transcriptional regulator [Inquilinus ginsengisoli]MDR6293552.1 AcrR family transcriptional regulator [Inquilinus ginsengisoli]